MPEFRDLEDETFALAFGSTVKRLREEKSMSLNQLARLAGVDPAYIHRIEARGRQRPPLPRRPVVKAIAAALGASSGQTDQLLSLSGHTPSVLLDIGGWDPTLATVAELLADRTLSPAAREDFAQLVRLAARRWARSDPKLE